MGGIRVGVRVSREGLGRLSKTSVLSFKHLSYSAQPLKIYSILHIYVFYTSLLMLCLHKAYPIYIYIVPLLDSLSIYPTPFTLYFSFSIRSPLTQFTLISFYSFYSPLILLDLIFLYPINYVSTQLYREYE